MIPRDFHAMQEMRRQQIDTLKIFNDNVTNIQENAEYKVEFLAGQTCMQLDVQLGADFPYENPKLSIRPPIVHPWVAEDSTTITGAPGLINFTIHSDLGRVVQAIIREFEQHPPKLLEETNMNSNYSLHNNSVGNMHSSQSFTVNSPVQTLAFPSLQSLSIEELINLKENEDLQDEFICSLPQTLEINKTIQDLIEQIESLAKENLSKRESLENLKHSISERVTSVAELKNNYETLKKQHSELSSVYTPHAIMAALATSAIRADEEAEVLAEAFLGGSIDCDTFLRKYEAKKSLGHSRKAYQERLSHQLSQFDKAV